MTYVIALLIFVVLTVLTQLGGVIFVLTWIVCRLLLPRDWGNWRRLAANVGLFAFTYAAVSALVIPPLAALGGRVPLPCHAAADRPFAAGSTIICALNRHYVDARLIALLTNLSREIDRLYPGTTTLYLDANFPFLNGFPLLPHLSHSDGRKLDLAYYYATPAGSYLPETLRSPIGYWAFEQPDASDPTPCPGKRWLSLRWDLQLLQRMFPHRPLEPDRTRSALQWLATEGHAFGLQRIFVEPYLAARLGVSSPLLGFQGCRAARHDDHIHIQVGPR